MTNSSPLTDNYKKRSEDFDGKFIGAGLMSDDGDYDYVSVYDQVKDFNRDTYLSALKSMVEVVEDLKLDELGHPDRPFYGTVAARSHAKTWNAALDTLKAELERTIREIEATN